MSETKIAVTGVATPNTAEGVVATSDAVHWSGPGQGLIIRGVLNFTAGTTTTSVSIRCRKGANTITGATIGPALGLVHTLGAAAPADIAYEFLDPAPVADPISPSGAAGNPSNVYSITIQQTGGTAAGNVNYGTVGLTPAATGW
jgi:hypothetical protein